jgi:hypothetical protein
MVLGSRRMLEFAGLFGGIETRQYKEMFISGFQEQSYKQLRPYYSGNTTQ